MKLKPDPSFRYTSSADTDLRKTFARIREGLRQALGTSANAPTPVMSRATRTETSESHGRK